MTRDALAIDPSPMAAAQILDNVRAVFRDDTGELPGCPVVAQDQIVIGLAADRKRQRLKRTSRALAGRREHQKSGWRQSGARGRVGSGRHLVRSGRTVTLRFLSAQ